MAATPSYHVPALEKGLDVLETLATAAAPQSLSEIAAVLKRSSNELFRMLNCLEQRGYIVRDAVSGKYTLTLRLYGLSHRHSGIGKLLRTSQLPMRALAEKKRESVHLSVLERNSLRVVAQVESPERVRLSVEVGGVFDPVATASGRLLLAHVDDDWRTQACTASRAWRNLPARGRAGWLGSLAGIRRTGTSLAASETIEGVRDIAVLVGNPECGVMAALAVTRLVRRERRDDEAALIAAVRATARDITHALGWGST